MSGQVVTTVAELDALPDDTLIEATGTYISRSRRGTFERCWARPVPEYITGPRREGQPRLWEVLVYASDVANRLTTSALITSATVLYRPDAGPLATDPATDAANADCPHPSSTGVDQTPIRDPRKTWRCDACGTHWSPADETEAD